MEPISAEFAKQMASLLREEPETETAAAEEKGELPRGYLWTKLGLYYAWRFAGLAVVLAGIWILYGSHSDKNWEEQAKTEKKELIDSLNVARADLAQSKRDNDERTAQGKKLGEFVEVLRADLEKSRKANDERDVLISELSLKSAAQAKELGGLRTKVGSMAADAARTMMLYGPTTAHAFAQVPGPPLNLSPFAAATDSPTAASDDHRWEEKQKCMWLFNTFPWCQ